MVCMVVSLESKHVHSLSLSYQTLSVGSTQFSVILSGSFPKWVGKHLRIWVVQPARTYAARLGLYVINRCITQLCVVNRWRHCVVFSASLEERWRQTRHECQNTWPFHGNNFGGEMLSIEWHHIKTGKLSQPIAELYIYSRE